MTGDEASSSEQSVGDGASTTTGTGDALTPSLRLDGRDAPWLGAGLAAGLIAIAVYLATNPYPAYGAGLYVKIASEIVAHGYTPPAHVPGYTAEGVPFAYPPLQFYLLAVLLDLGADPVGVARVLPSVAVLAALVPTYLLARDYAGSRPGGAAAAVTVALTPQLLQWHVSAGGVVRAFAFCYALTAIYAGYHVFVTGSRRAVTVGLLGFAATVLTHPTYALFVVVSYLLLWAIRDRSADGFGRGAVVGLGGLALATPWFAWAVATHGPDVYVAASGTHGGVGGGLATLVGGPSLALLPLAGAAYLLIVNRDTFIAAWAVAVELLFAQPRFTFAVGAVVLAAVGVDVARRLDVLAGRVAGVDRRAALAAVCLVAASVAGGAYLTHEMTLTTDPSMPAFLDREAVDAMVWAAGETPPDATFVVLGDAAEWFPALTGRTILVGPWGVEWRSAAAYDRHLEAYETVSRCHSADCVESTTAQFGERPDYVYLPKGQYTVRGKSVVAFGTLERSFEQSSGWERAYENDGVVVFRATGDGEAGRRVVDYLPSSRSFRCTCEYTFG